MQNQMPILQQFADGAAIDWSKQEYINDMLYDWQTYAAAGQAQLVFFATPVGQGTSIFDATKPKTYEDTNLEGNGSMMSRGEAFLVKAIGLQFVAGNNPVQENLTAAAPAAYTKYAANDEFTFYKQGWAEFKVLNKEQLRVGPLGVLPPLTMGEVDAAAGVFWSEAAAADHYESITATKYKIKGPKYMLAGSGVRLEYGTRFAFSLNWSKAVALPSTTAGMVQAQFMGHRMRVGQ